MKWRVSFWPKLLNISTCSSRRPGLWLSTKSSSIPRRTHSGGRGSADQFAELLHVDVAARDDGDDRTFAHFSSQCSSNGQPARTFGNNSRLFRHQPHRLLRFIQSDDNIIVHDRFHPLPHAGEHALAAGAIDERLLEIFYKLRRPFFERKRGWRGRF